MRDAVVRSYAEALFGVALRHEGAEEFGRAAAAVASLYADPKTREFLRTPRIPVGTKKKVLERALGPSVPPMLVTFLKVVLDKGRERLVPQIAAEYERLLDQHRGRRYVDVDVAHPLDEAAERELALRMSRATGATVIPRVRVNPSILGGIVIRDSDTVYDGSVRRRLGIMRRRLLATELPSSASPAPPSAPSNSRSPANEQ